MRKFYKLVSEAQRGFGGRFVSKSVDIKAKEEAMTNDVMDLIEKVVDEYEYIVKLI